MTDNAARPKPCSRCAKPRETAGRYCRACRARYMRKWRARRVTVSRETLKQVARIVREAAR